ncbi:polynucleotide 3'-phosphatase ZDP-like isoform X1 [Panicum virgatum]|uniref:polynucleotide 3'-phosphatase ZDP-like isoform X1 n=1 Tax=Panicum virgatum TaxID=38727 RepID=UPI0019D5BA66|nr:polynucleotide 3'-phosphatase ZDP-like isoform X1 [Panicum virgatum]
MLVTPCSFLSIARNTARLRFLLAASAARAARLAMSTAPQAAAAAVSVEYAKSGRSTCKGCSGAIASGALRLGASTPDPRGFDATKWYHVACFPSDASHPLGPVESINGFDSIKEADREELHELVKNRERDQTAEPSPKKAKTQMPSPSEGVSDKASVSVEYAKSGRSTCKGCSKNIAKGALRLGASFHDPRGFENTKWYHVACFPTASYPVFPVENLKGFDSIEDHDREKLQELVENHKSIGDSNEVTEKNPEELKNRDNKVDKTVNPLDEPSPKKVKTHMSSSMKAVSEKASVLVEYAKSGRSTCKGCSENIAKGALRLGASAHDPRGYDSTKWYHVACFPTSSYPIFPVENLKGFDSVKNNDREKLLELGENYKRDGNAADQSSEPSLKEEMVDSTRISKEGSENNLEEVKLSAGNNRMRPVISFSVSDTNKDYKGATLPAHWKAFETVIFREQEDGLHASAKIAAFDFDGCLAKTSVRIIGADKWSLQYKSIPKILQSLYNDGYKLVIFTNESNIDRWKNKRQEAVDSKVGRLDNFIECVKVPMQVFIACGLGQGKGTPDDPYRKPNPGMWWLMAQHFNSGIEIDMDKSFYVGDAAGREKDHSDADIKFAEAIGLKFHVPEEYFGP